MFYEKDIPYERARRFFGALPAYPVDTGFMDEMHITADDKARIPSASLIRSFPDLEKPGFKLPVLVHKVQPDYTEAARLARAKGVVVIEVVIRKDGSVNPSRVLRSVGYGLDEISIRTIRDKWVFKPASLNDSPKDCPSQIEVLFDIF